MDNLKEAAHRGERPGLSSMVAPADPARSDYAYPSAPLHRVFYGWKLLAVFWFILVANLAFPMTGGSLLVTAMATGLNFSREQLGLPFSVYFGVIGLSSPLVAWLIMRFGVRATLVLGNLCLAAGALALATIVTTPGAAIFWFGGVIGFAVASGGNLTTQTAIPRWFIRRRALAYAIILTASAIGGIVVAPILTGFISRSPDGWRSGWWLLAGFGLVAALLAWLFVRERPEDIGQYADGAAQGPDMTTAAAKAENASVTTSQAFARPDFWAIIAASAIITAGVSLVLSHGVANALDAGYSTSATGWALALYAFTGFLGKVVVGAVGDRFNPAYVWAALLVPLAAGLLVAAFAMSGLGLYVYSIAVGFGLGGALVCQPATVAHRFGAGGFARVAGFMFLFQAVAGVSAPALAGWFFSSTSGYRWSFAVTALACILGAVTLIITCRRTNKAVAEG